MLINKIKRPSQGRQLLYLGIKLERCSIHQKIIVVSQRLCKLVPSYKNIFH